MEPSIEGAWRRLERGKDAVRARVERWPEERRTHRPDPTVWSMVDVVEHLVLVEDGIRTALAKAPTPERPRHLKWARWWRFPLLRAALKVGVRVRAPSQAILPAGGKGYEALLEDWERSRTLFRAWLQTFDRGIIDTPRFRHPIVGWLTVPQALVFAADHLDHHLAQLDRLGRRREV